MHNEQDFMLLTSKSIANHVFTIWKNKNYFPPLFRISLPMGIQTYFKATWFVPMLHYFYMSSTCHVWDSSFIFLSWFTLRRCLKIWYKVRTQYCIGYLALLQKLLIIVSKRAVDTISILRVIRAMLCTVEILKVLCIASPQVVNDRRILLELPNWS